MMLFSSIFKVFQGLAHITKRHDFAIIGKLVKSDCSRFIM